MTTFLLLLFVYIAITHSRSYPSKGCDDAMIPSFNGTSEQFLQHNAIQRSYIIHLPPTYSHSSADEGHSLILNLHGFTSSAWIRMAGSLMNDHADMNNYIAVYPQGTSYGVIEIDGDERNLTSWNDLSCSGSPSPIGPTCSQIGSEIIDDVNVSSWNETNALPLECQDVFGCNWCNCLADDVDFIDTLLDELESVYCIDRSRVYATGYSNGGMMTQRLGCELNHRFAAIAPQHGQMSIAHVCKPKYDVKMPIFNIWGTNDDVVPGDTLVASLRFLHCLHLS